MGAEYGLTWREAGEEERPWVTDPPHPNYLARTKPLATFVKRRWAWIFWRNVFVPNGISINSHYS
jgi:hypothetical protein